MSRSRFRSRSRQELWRRLRPRALGVLLGVALALPAASALGGRSSFSPSGSGTKALYLLFEELGYVPSRAFDLREVDPATQLLVVIGHPTSTREGAQWLDWAGAGKVLLVAPPLGDESGFCGDHKLGKLTLARAQSLTGWGSQAVPHPEVKLRPSACVLKAPPAATVLAGRPDQALALALPTTAGGRLLALAHEDLLCNQNLDRDDLVVLLRRWLGAHLPYHARVTFLEERAGGQLLDLIKRSNLTALALHALLWLVLLYWALTPRFGDAFPPPTSTRRAFAQHARALGALYRHRGASASMLRHQFDRFLARLTGRSERRPLQGTRHGTEGRGPGRPALAASIATRTGRDVDAVESLLAQLERAMQDPSGNDPRQIQRHYRLSQSLAALSRVSAARASGGKRARQGRSGIR